MKQLLAAIFVVSGSPGIYSQDSFYDHIPSGIYGVGYSDTVLFDDEIPYSQYGYTGAAPVFTGIWFPLEKKNGREPIRYGEYRMDNLPEGLVRVYRELSRLMDESFTETSLSYSFPAGDPVDYGNHTPADVLNRIKLSETKSVRAAPDAEAGWPVIVYHHGSQGLPEENSIMAEFFASRGYIFVSANFHLPYPNTVYGLIPFALENEKRHNQSTARLVMRFAGSLTRSQHLFFIGHSWGAQEGWCFLHDSTPAGAFVSMETTIEYKTDSLEIKDKWPYVYDALKTRKHRFSIPILLLASVDDNLNFDFFEGAGRSQTVYASYSLPFAHESYTSSFLMRYFLRDKYPQPDTGALPGQIKGYSAHLELIYGFLESVRAGNKFDTRPFQPSFVFRL